MLNFIALPRSAVLVNIVILHFLQVTLLLMFQLVTFIILLNEIFLYSSAPLTPMAAPRPLAGGRYEMNSSLIRNNNNKNTHAATLPLAPASLAPPPPLRAACGPRGPGSGRPATDGGCWGSVGSQPPRPARAPPGSRLSSRPSPASSSPLSQHPLSAEAHLREPLCRCLGQALVCVCFRLWLPPALLLLSFSCLPLPLFFFFFVSKF